MTLKLWGGESDSGCCSAADVEDARRVAAQLGIPHYVFNFTDDFDANVVAPYVDAYAAGETPNPCVECNRTMKFGRVIERAEQLGFDEVATGHHARVVDTPSGRAIARRRSGEGPVVRAVHARSREIARTRLPIGEMTKAEVRARAHDLGLRTAAKRESMDVCFIKRGGRSAFLGNRIGRRPGAIVDTAGEVVGAHDGVDRFTIGQRRGTGVAQGERRYVVDIAPDTATVTVGPRDALLRDHVSCAISPSCARRRSRCSCRRERTACRSRAASSATPCGSTSRSRGSRRARSSPATTVTSSVGGGIAAA